ncbi:hypothetical protein HHI36_011241 [Cryptolaemus montrouzieri]|uniref:Uncharacterized protein n=1 Tax=Cryptolaemus montrouzieri TaxID=559131 RepID=A0ABD2MM06_9CUCU
MSSKKQPFIKPPNETSGNSIPPRYQHPPLPPNSGINNQGILKHPPLKDAKSYPLKTTEKSATFQLQQSTEQGKFYPNNIKYSYPAFPHKIFVQLKLARPKLRYTRN